mmetsp:Transcript_71127/g.203888  ORF Transcript_71127/g.203888 Transcript_71127/m.203888 type:complete len:439 (-) Transcript_71127:2184-3500(-)
MSSVQKSTCSRMKGLPLRRDAGAGGGARGRGHVVARGTAGPRGLEQRQEAEGLRRHRQGVVRQRRARGGHHGLVDRALDRRGEEEGGLANALGGLVNLLRLRGLPRNGAAAQNWCEERHHGAYHGVVDPVLAAIHELNGEVFRDVTGDGRLVSPGVVREEPAGGLVEIDALVLDLAHAHDEGTLHLADVDGGVVRHANVEEQVRHQNSPLACKHIQLNLGCRDAISLVHHLRGHRQVQAHRGEVLRNCKDPQELRGERGVDDVGPRPILALLLGLEAGGLLRGVPQALRELPHRVASGEHRPLAGGAASCDATIRVLLRGGLEEAHAADGWPIAELLGELRVHHLRDLRVQPLPDLGAAQGQLDGAVLEDVDASRVARRERHAVPSWRQGNASFLPGVVLVEFLHILEAQLVVRLRLDQGPQCGVHVVGQGALRHKRP